MGKKVRIRSFIIGGFFTLFFIAVAIRLYWVQVVEGKALSVQAEGVWSQEMVLQPKRGTIMDRNGQVLAQDGEAYTVAVNPRLIHDYEQEELVIGTLAPLLGMETPEGMRKLRDRVSAKNKEGKLLAQVEIRNEGWKVDKEIADQIKKKREELELQGVYLIEQSKRYYPADELAAQVLGYVDKENIARSGLELVYDETLKGVPGRIAYEKDALGYELPDGKASIVKPVDGKDLRLTIDRNIQHYIEEALSAMNEQYHPKAAMVVAADPNTMEILGMSSLPAYNPNTYWTFAEKSDFAMNRTISAQYEPGSTFKIVTLAGAVDQGIFQPQDKYKSGRINVAGTTMGDHNNRQGWGEISYLDGLKRSSNVAFIKLGYEGLGAEKLREYIEKFGFGQKTGIDLPGEIGGVIDFHYPTEVASATFGQGKVAVTAIQQVAAVSAIANGGKLMKPYLVKEIVDPETNRPIKKVKPEVVRQVISEQKAREVSDYLEQVVSDQKIGTGRRVYIDGYRIAGKTGTAQKVIDGTYAEDSWVVSFIGYAPADNPKVVLCVIIDEPDIDGDYRRGSDVSAPVFKDIMSKTLRYFGVAKTNTSVGVTQWKDVNAVTMPDLTGKDAKESGDALSRFGMTYEMLGGGKVARQYPKPGERIAAEQHVYLLGDSVDKPVFPDMAGRPMREVLEVCSLLDAECTYSGDGYVTSQNVDTTGASMKISFVFDPFRPEQVTEDHTTEAEASG